MGGTLLGLIYVIASTIFFGMYVTPRKHSQLANAPYFFGMGLGLLVCTVGSAIAAGQFGPETLKYWHLGLIGGSLWTIGTGCMIAAVPLIGVSRAIPVKNTTGVLGVFIGVLMFGELLGHGPLPPLLALAGSVLIVVSPLFFARTMKTDEQVKPENIRPGILYAIGACLAYAVYSIAIKQADASGCPPIGYVGLVGAGAFVTIVAWSIWMKAVPVWAGASLKEKWLGILGGIIWAGATFFLFLAVSKLGLAISWSFIQANSLAAVGYSVFALSEIKLRHHLSDVILGAGTVLLGVVLLGLARVLGG